MTVVMTTRMNTTKVAMVPYSARSTVSASLPANQIKTQAELRLPPSTRKHVAYLEELSR